MLEVPSHVVSPAAAQRLFCNIDSGVLQHGGTLVFSSMNSASLLFAMLTKPAVLLYVVDVVIFACDACFTVKR